jgi:hypothetical protein
MLVLALIHLAVQNFCRVTLCDAFVRLSGKLNLPVVNLWNAFLVETNFQIDAWKVGDHLPGTLKYDSIEIVNTLKVVTIRTKRLGLHFNLGGYEVFY